MPSGMSLAISRMGFITDEAVRLSVINILKAMDKIQEKYPKISFGLFPSDKKGISAIILTNINNGEGGNLEIKILKNGDFELKHKKNSDYDIKVEKYESISEWVEEIIFQDGYINIYINSYNK